MAYWQVDNHSLCKFYNISQCVNVHSSGICQTQETVFNTSLKICDDRCNMLTGIFGWKNNVKWLMSH